LARTLLTPRTIITILGMVEPPNPILDRAGFTHQSGFLVKPAVQDLYIPKRACTDLDLWKMRSNVSFERLRMNREIGRYFATTQ
jgi:hypothetical protein